MENQNKALWSKLLMEVLWWCITAVVVWIVVQPLWKDFVKYDFVYDSIINIVVFITATRYLFTLKYTFLAKAQVAKFIIIFLAIPLCFYLTQEFFAYQDFLDQEGTVEFQAFWRPGIQTDQLYDAIDYTTKQISFFGVGAILSSILLPFRLLISYWRVYNKTGTV